MGEMVEISVEDLIGRLTNAVKGDLIVEVEKIGSDKYKIPLETAMRLGLVLTDSNIFKKTSTPADITVSRKVKTLAAGTNTQEHNFSSHAVTLYWVSVQNPDGASRAIKIALRNPADDVVGYLGSDNYGVSNISTTAGHYLTMSFPGGFEIPYDYDILITWAAMTGSNTSIHSAVYRWLNDQ